MTVEQPETLEVLERAERRRRLVKVALAVLVVVAVLAYLFLPRTLASGEVDGEPWSLRVAPLSLDPGVELVGREPAAGEPGRAARSDRLDDTVVWWIGDPDVDPQTIVVGQTRRGVDSVRVATGDPPDGEARIERVGWRRYHVDRLPGHHEVLELVAIDAEGRPMEVSELRVDPGDAGR